MLFLIAPIPRLFGFLLLSLALGGCRSLAPVQTAVSGMSHAEYQALYVADQDERFPVRLRIFPGSMCSISEHWCVKKRPNIPASL